MDTTTRYHLPTGELVTVTASEGVAYDVPEGAVVLSDAEYAPLLAAAQAAAAAHVTQLEAAQAARGLAVHTALLAAGLPQSVARILSGYTPPGEGDDWPPIIDL
ncbi:hypothetical protein SUDANB1_05688 [Streptomyces sp. enrichment culture]|uniref:hypothetical protein n=1 Tax=Streptomyces sp. enrichment culture TaxID=1795815 RepID=UPI003F5518F0